MPKATVTQSECLDWLKAQPDNSVDLIVTSGPYEAARTYGIDFKLKGQAFVDWMFPRVVEMVRVSRGLVAFVLEGQTKNFAWSAVPVLLMADLHRAGIVLRKPLAFHRVGIPGSGGPDWFRNDWEFICCCTGGGKLVYADNTAMGHPPKWAPGGAMANRKTDGTRVNQWGHSIDSGATVVDEGGVVRSKGKRPSHVAARDEFGFTPGAEPSQTERTNGMKRSEKIAMNGHGAPGANGGTKTNRRVMSITRRGSRDNGTYNIPVLANPGNIVQQTYTPDEVAEMLPEAGDALHALVGGGVMGSKLAHENEAPFPEKIPEWFIRSFTKSGDIVCDPFSGSGTTASVAIQLGRNFTGCDLRKSQVILTLKRVRETRMKLAKIPKQAASLEMVRDTRATGR